MHQISFLLKRGHLVTNSFGQKLLYAVPGMTPARFDILCFVRQQSIRVGWRGCAAASQKRIREAMGLHSSTISKMLARMEKLGWIERDSNLRDGRMTLVTLTRLGMRKAWQAMRLIYRNRLLLQPFERIARWFRPNDTVFRALDCLRDSLELIACAFGDHAGFSYDYGAAPPYCMKLPGSIGDIDDGARADRDPPAPFRFWPRLSRPYWVWVAPLLRGAPREIADGDPNEAIEDYDPDEDAADDDAADEDATDDDAADEDVGDITPSA